MEDLARRFARYVEQQLPGAQDVRVQRIARIHGGASRETYRVRVDYLRDGVREERGLILRRDPPGSLIETDRRVEFAAYRAFYGSEVPVPEPLWLEQDTRWLERPFFVMREIEGCEAGPQALLAPPYSAHLERIGVAKWKILGAIARARPEENGLADALEEVAPADCWRRELGHWERVIDEDALEPQPIVRAAIRALRRAPPPPPARVGVVHGDFRTGNFLVDPAGEIRGILDWEMCHLGDPLEDLAWSINRIWCWARDERVGGLLPRGRAIAIWEAASGLRADPAALRWWELFGSVKAQAIWLSSGREYRDGKSRDPLLGYVPWSLVNAQDRVILETLGKLA
jgi:aminoglycoside phosphotransferase (APT) family kinase protein